MAIRYFASFDNAIAFRCAQSLVEFFQLIKNDVVSFVRYRVMPVFFW